ncbi:alpha/beta fold hydrolase [Verrucomicrobiaceae bacterium R5-34]|nr:alpha/beta fold hydrolase [Verrucomicrobiaceae bacterium R5-34]
MIPFISPHETSAAQKLNGLVMRDHRFQLPLDYQQPEGPMIEVFAREVCLRDKDTDKNLPWMIFFQGGPGFASPRLHGKSGWIGEVLKSHRLLLLDQRGTGLSSRILPQTLATLPDAQAQADYLTHFRADNIVRDAEAIRHTLLGADKKWKGAGQSYGGFCLLSYLSMHPEGLSGVIITGGVACVKRHIEDNYRITYQRVLEKNEAFYRRYPADEELARKIAKHLDEHEVMLPSGVRLTSRRFQQLGMAFGASGGFESIHYLMEGAFVEGASGEELSYDFLSQVERHSGYETNPIFCILHESIYAEGYATQWAAERVRAEFPEVDAAEGRFIFTGEMIAPSMLDDYIALQPLKECAEILAQKSDWGPLYDLEQLARNEVPVVAISYYDDMYVPIEWSAETAKHIPHFQIWVTNEWEHNGIGVDGPRIFGRLLEMLADAK